MTQALVIVALTLIGVDFLAFLGVLSVRHRLRGQRGFALTTIVAVVMGSIVVSNLVDAINAIALLVAVGGGAFNHDYPVALYLIGNALRTAAMVWAFYKVRRLARNRRPDGATMEPRNRAPQEEDT